MPTTDPRTDRPPHATAGPRRSVWGRLAALGAVGLLVSLVFGVTTASVQQSLGPHEAEYSVTTDDLVTVDLGPLGTIEIPSPLPLTLGIEVTVEEIPRDVTAVDPARTVQALGQDLQSYVQFFTGPQATIEDAARALVVDAARRTGLSLLVLASAVLGGRALLGPQRRRELAVTLSPHRGKAVRVTVIVVVVAVLGVSSVAGAVRERPEGRASAVFDGTPLEGARITGRLAGIVDTYGSYVVDAYRRNEVFYSAAQAEVAAAWDQRAQAIAARERSDARLQENLVDDPLRRPTEEPEEAVDPVVMVLVADLHCNVGMTRVIRTVAERSGADLLLNAGDTTVNGTSVEQYCVTTFADAVPAGVPKVVADGNHDSLQTAEHERDAGWTVLDGQVVEAAGVRILGDRDPSQTQVGGGTALISDETVTEAGERLAEVACEDGAVDILLVHNPRLGSPAMDSGCVPVQLSGHTHRRIGPLQIGDGMRYVSSTTAGATAGGATIGPLNGVASLTVLRWDPEERRMIDLQVVQVAADGSATVGPREPFGQPEPTGGEGDAGEGDDGVEQPDGGEDGGGGGGIPAEVPGSDQAPDTGGARDDTGGARTGEDSTGDDSTGEGVARGAGGASEDDGTP